MIKKLLFPILMSCYMAFLMTGLITYINTGFDGDFGWRWLQAFLIAWPIAGVLVLVGGQRIRHLSERLAARLK
jgi:MFS family permease